MNNFDKKLSDLKKTIQNASMDDRAKEKLEGRLRSVWHKQHTTMEQKKTWKERFSFVLPVTLSGATLVIFAAVTAVSFAPEGTSKTTILNPMSVQGDSNTTIFESASLNESDGFVDTFSDLAEQESEKKSRVYSEDESQIVPPVTEIAPEPVPPFDYDNGGDPKKDTLSYGEKNQQLFDESVNLAIETEKDIIAFIDELRGEITNLDGYVVTIEYYKSTGATVQMKLPAEKLTAFESYLREQDITNTLSVAEYSIKNVSEKVVQIDEVITNTDQKITALEDELNGTLSTNQKKYLEEQITQQEEYLSKKEEEREELIAQYSLVDIQLTITEWASFWEGHYWQYDQSTLSGSVKYNLAKVIYKIIRNGGEFIRFMIWLIIYGILGTPLMILGRKIYKRGKEKAAKRREETQKKKAVQ